MYRQSSRSTPSIDAIDCTVNTNDLALEHEVLKQEHEPRRDLSKSRRDETSKRPNEYSGHRSARRSPPSVTRKRHPSPPSIALPSSSSRSHHHHYPSQRHHRVSPPSPSPPPPPISQSSSRHRRPAIPPTKRPHSESESPHERRPPTHRSRPELPTERTIGDVLTSIPSAEEQTTPKKITSKQEIADLSLVSEDESIKTHDIRSNGATTNESSSGTTSNKLHSTPSLPILHSNPNESLLDMSNIPQDCELSLFAKSVLSTANTSSMLTTPTIPANDFMQTIDLVNKYKTMQTIPNNNPQVDIWSKEISIIIQKQIELQKIELDYREREIKLRERELAEREKRFNERSIEITSMTSVTSEPLVVNKPTIIEESIQSKSEIIIDQDIKNDESVVKSIPLTADTLKVKLSNRNGSDQPAVTRKNTGKSRFSQIIADPSIFTSHQKPVVDLYSDELDDNQSSPSINTNNSLKKPIISKILAPSETPIATIGTDLKVTSSNSFRKVEIQSGNIDKSTTSKGSSHDLRLTLSKNRTKQQTNDDYGTNDNQPISDDEQTIKINKPMSSKINENKQQSDDYSQQRSITTTSIETIIDDTNDKRDNHRQQRINSSRQQHSSPSNNNSNERSYIHASTSQQQSKYGSNQKRTETDDLRSRLFEQKYPKSSQTTYKNNY